MTSKARWFQIKARSARKDTAEVLIYGDIGESWDAESVTAAQFVRDLQALDAPNLTVRINSFGGSVPDGLAIFNALRRYPGTVAVHVDGLAASIASLIAMAGDTVSMAENAQLMIHAPWSGAVGNAADLRATADMLDRFAQAMVSCYARLPAEQAQALLTDGEDHWFTATEALAAGLVDEITAAQRAAARYRHNRFTAASAAWRNLMEHDDNNLEHDDELDPSAESASTRSTRAQRRHEREIVAARAEELRQIDAMCQLFGQRRPPEERVELDRLRASARDTGMTAAQFGQSWLALQGRDAEPMTPPGWHAPVDSITHRLETGTAGPSGYIDTHEPRLNARSEGVIDAIIAKATRAAPKTELGRQLSRRSFVDITAQHLEWGGVRTRDMSPRDVIKASLSGPGHGTTDFPSLLTESGNRMLRTAYEAAPSGIKQLAKKITAPDFRAIQHLQLSEMAELLPVPEHAEYKHGSMLEAKEVFRIFTFGRIFGLTRQALINDDLGAFGTMAVKLGQAAATLEGKFLADLLAENSAMGPLLADGKSVFHANHKNVGTASVIAVASLAAAVAAMRLQKGLDGVTPINITPTALLVPAAIEVNALEIVAAINPVEPAKVNPYAGKFAVHVDPRLDAIDDKAWYVIAPDAVDGLQVAYLDGQEGPYVETRVGWEVDGVEMKARLDFGAGFVDYRGWFRNPGPSGIE